VCLYNRCLKRKLGLEHSFFITLERGVEREKLEKEEKMVRREDA